MQNDYKLEFDAIAFDCDGTLSAIEGITELAGMNDCQDTVRDLTETAMSGSGITPELFSQRLQLAKPNSKQLAKLGEIYYNNRTANIEMLIAQLQQDGKKIFILSAGLTPSVCDFARRLNIPTENVFAVGISFNENGEYLAFDHASPLIHNNGKAEIIKQLASDIKIIYVGDGANDLAVKPHVQHFIGFGAHFPRKNIKQASDFYITTNNALEIMNILTSGVD